jgi:hypothetical protein
MAGVDVQLVDVAGPDPTRQISLGLYAWQAMILTGALPAVQLYLWRRHMRERPKQGLCQKCGYDLRATPDRCPECGTVVSKTQNSRSSI